jgi:predicted transcriptional regulator of viral defense system
MKFKDFWKSSIMNFIKKLRNINRLFYTLGDLEKILKSEFHEKGDYSRNSIYVIMNRLVKKGEVIRITRGIYILPERYGEIDAIANLLYRPSYLSFESALSRYAVLSQIPYTLTFATLRKSKNFTFPDFEVTYRQIKKELFFGYVSLENNLLVATPEKALLDMIYLSSFGKLYFDYTSIDLNKIDMAKIDELSGKFPVRVKKFIRKLS